MWANINRKKALFSQSSAFIQKWDLLMLYLLLYVTVVTPFELSFLKAANLSNLTVDGAGVLFFVNRLVDILFFVDVYINFHLSYFDPNQGTFIDDISKIRCHYLKSWFLVDIVSVVPFDLLVTDNTNVENGTNNTYLQLIRAIKLLKLIRLLKILRAGRLITILQRMFGASFQFLKAFAMMVRIYSFAFSPFAFVSE
jgi:hypothetical protein